MATAVVARVDAEPAFYERARGVCERWRSVNPCAAVEEWWTALRGPWEEARALLLDPGEEGARLRQSSPFTGILSNQERWRIYRDSLPT